MGASITQGLEPKATVTNTSDLYGGAGTPVGSLSLAQSPAGILQGAYPYYDGDSRPAATIAWQDSPKATITYADQPAY